MLLFCCAAATAAEQPATGTEAAAPCTAPEDCPHALEDPGARNWADASYEYVTSRADSLAQRLDAFFGVPTSDQEAADSVLRLQLEYEWDEDDGSKLKPRLRGKVDLPRIDKRLSLVFSEEDDERRDVLPDLERQEGDVALQYRVREREHSRLYFSVGTNASLEFRTSLRYKYVYPISRDWRVQFTERIYYKEDDGFGTITRGDLDYSLSDDRIVRWTTDAEYGEETDGTEWGTRLSYQLRLNDKEALAYFGAVSAQTDPQFIGAYSVGFRYRRNVFRPWIFFEIEPAHLWRREYSGASREPVWLLTFRLELLEEIQNRLPAPAPVQAAEP